MQVLGRNLQLESGLGSQGMYRTVTYSELFWRFATKSCSFVQCKICFFGFLGFFLQLTCVLSAQQKLGGLGSFSIFLCTFLSCWCQKLQTGYLEFMQRSEHGNLLANIFSSSSSLHQGNNFCFLVVYFSQRLLSVSPNAFCFI